MLVVLVYCLDLLDLNDTGTLVVEYVGVLIIYNRCYTNGGLELYFSMAFEIN